MFSVTGAVNLLPEKPFSRASSRGAAEGWNIKSRGWVWEKLTEGRRGKVVFCAGENGVEQGVRGDKWKKALWGINKPNFNARTEVQCKNLRKGKLICEEN